MADAFTLATVGGNAVNVAVHLGRRGHRVTYYGAIGGDEDGRRVVDEIARNGVATDRVRVIPDGRTATTDIKSGPNGARVIAAEDFGVCKGYRPDPGEIAELSRMRQVHIGWDEADAVAARALAAGARLAVVTCGAIGSMAGDARRRVRTGAAAIPVLDTLGAGDTFIAGFLGAFLAGRDLCACLEAGRDAAATTCRHFGGFPQQPKPLDSKSVSQGLADHLHRAARRGAVSDA